MFDTTTLTNFPFRYLLIAESCLPFLIIFVIGFIFSPTKNAGANIKGRPPGWMFGLVWFVLVVMWTLALIVTAMDEPSCLIATLIGCFSFVALMACLFWLIFHKMHPDNYALILATTMMVATVISSLNGLAALESKTLTSIFYGIIGAWLGTATLLNFLEINVK